MFGAQIALGYAMIALTTVIHTAGVLWLIATLKHFGVATLASLSYVRMTRILVVTILLIALFHTVEIWAWALLYHLLDQFESFETALYFSTVTFTTLGYGDIVLQERWQLLSSVEAVNGIILFGVSTAVVFEILRRLLQIAGVFQLDKESPGA